MEFTSKTPPERPIVPTSPGDWEAKKQIIRELYMDQNMILNEVMEIMVTKHKFKATARMYKGQFSKWKWTKYNKSGKPGPVNTITKSRVSKRKSLLSTRKFPPKKHALQRAAAATQHHLVPSPQHAVRYSLQYFTDLERQLETTLNAYATLISCWAERETPWRPTKDPSAGGHNNSGGQLITPLTTSPPHSILHQVWTAQQCFLAGQAQQGGDMLRLAFLAIENAVENFLDLESLWDCCLAVTQLALTTGWTDVLGIFARYLHQYTSIKLGPGHPLTHIAASLHRLACLSPSPSSSPNPATKPNPPRPPISTSSSTETNTSTNPSNHSDHQTYLQTYLHKSWDLWINHTTSIRGPQDDLTIHLKRGYITLIDRSHPMARTILRDFAVSLHSSVACHGRVATTARVLELEGLLGRMYLPLFTGERGREAEVMLRGVVGKILEGAREKKHDRYLVFSARNFMASIAEYGGDEVKARRKDLFWLQTAELVEGRLRAAGNEDEAEEIRCQREVVKRALGFGGRLLEC
ncbi:uncharacterized protein C8A04DRAFT_40138 [Dichotomopilus funicola]|uniref:Clr5 domain-containing protein n=1 Tax=Dichotomopilus funicola TaxID=1934379 RepID=A0AAN6ZJH1_9PEZI|nr:hypothetical protein C8A04DRAFT_40138 [Dichotomopilus funicola]